MGAGILAAAPRVGPFYDGPMQLIFALLVLCAPESVEERFIAALKSDLAAGTTEKTAPLIAPVIRDKLPPSRLLPVYKAWRKHGKVVSLTRDPNTPFALNKLVRFILVQEKATTHVECYFDDKGQILSYFFRPAPADWDRKKILEVAGKWSGEYSFCVATGKHAWGGSRVGGDYPLGSVFKIYVLAELAAQMDADRIKADQKVKIREPLKSFPSGVLHTKPAGTEVSVDEMATKMISISDNTATDHLIHLVGREKIEQGLKGWHNSCVAKNQPFLTTREMFLIKGGGKETEIKRTFGQLCDGWAKADRETRMSWIRKMTDPFADKRIAELVQPIATGYLIRSKAVPYHLTFEWFAQPADICNLLLTMWDKKHPGAEHFLRYYATGSPIYPKEGLKYYGFKGGSETGVMAMSALAVAKDGHAVAVCVCRRGEIGSNALMETQQLASAALRLGLTRR